MLVPKHIQRVLRNFTGFYLKSQSIVCLLVLWGALARKHLTVLDVHPVDTLNLTVTVALAQRQGLLRDTVTNRRHEIALEDKHLFPKLKGHARLNR